jgi:hypothetical protein
MPIATIFSCKDPVVENTMESLMIMMILNEVPNFFNMIYDMILWKQGGLINNYSIFFDMLFEIYMTSVDPTLSEHPNFMKNPVKHESFKIAFKAYVT